MSETELKKISEMPADSLTGVSNPYVPGSELRYASKLTLHRNYDSNTSCIVEYQ